MFLHLDSGLCLYSHNSVPSELSQSDRILNDTFTLKISIVICIEFIVNWEEFQSLPGVFSSVVYHTQHTS